MQITPATQVEVSTIRNELANATTRVGSGDFLDGFPWDAVKWFRADLDVADFANLFLFWDGVAWGDEASRQLHQLHQGVDDFRRLAVDPPIRPLPHLARIQELIGELRSGKLQSREPYLIVAGENSSSRMVILDGNHRVAAALWCAQDTGNDSYLPRTAWAGLSARLVTYDPYRRSGVL
jgi:hypothetical protein